MLLAISGTQIRKEHRAAASCNRLVSVSLRAKVSSSSSWFFDQSQVLCILHHQDSTIPHLIGPDVATRVATNTAQRLHGHLEVLFIGTQPGRPQLSRTQRPENSVIFSHVPGPFSPCSVTHCYQLRLFAAACGWLPLRIEQACRFLISLLMLISRCGTPIEARLIRVPSLAPQCVWYPRCVSSSRHFGHRDSRASVCGTKST